jgi:hypothetical protein
MVPSVDEPCSLIDEEEEEEEEEEEQSRNSHRRYFAEFQTPLECR